MHPWALAVLRCLGCPAARRLQWGRAGPANQPHLGLRSGRRFPEVPGSRSTLEAPASQEVRSGLRCPPGPWLPAAQVALATRRPRSRLGLVGRPGPGRRLRRANQPDPQHPSDQPVPAARRGRLRLAASPPGAHPSCRASREVSDRGTSQDSISRPSVRCTPHTSSARHAPSPKPQRTGPSQARRKQTSRTPAAESFRSSRALGSSQADSDSRAILDSSCPTRKIPHKLSRSLPLGGIQPSGCWRQPRPIVEERADVEARALAPRGALEPAAHELAALDRRGDLRELPLGHLA